MQEIATKNIKLVAIQEIQLAEIERLGVALKEVEEEVKGTTLKVVVYFEASKGFLDKKANFMVAAYEEGVKDAREKVTAQCPSLDLGFLDELFASKKGKIMVNAPKDVPIKYVCPRS